MVILSLRILLILASIGLASPRTAFSVYENESRLYFSGFREGIGRLKGTLRVDEILQVPLNFNETNQTKEIKIVSGKVTAKRLGTLQVLGAYDGDSLFLPFETSDRTFIAATNRISYPIKLKRFLCKELNAPIKKSFIPRVNGNKSLLLSVDIDSEFRKLHGKNSLLAVVLAIKRTADIYNNTFNLGFRLKQIRLLNSSLKAKTSLSLLEQFRNSVSYNESDYFHLITAQRGYTDAIGLAYIGVGCTSYNVGFTDYASGFSRFVQTLAHEIGHGLNATHDPTDSKSIMTGNGDANIKNPYFSNFSFNEINSYLGDSCFADSQGSPLPTPSKSSYSIPTEKRKNVSISTKIASCNGKPCLIGTLSSKGTPLSGRVIELISFRPYKLLSTRKTNRQGDFRFILSKKGKYFVNDRMSQSTSFLLSY